MRRLEGKRALVTGAGTGIGKAVSLRLAEEGAAVVVHYATSREGAEDTVSRITAAGGVARAVQADLSLVESCGRLVDEAHGILGGIDILVNNAGVTERSDFLTVTPELFQRIVDTNLRAQFFVAQHAARHMQAQGGGSIIALASMHAFGGLAGSSIYAATKGAIVSLVRELAIELIPLRIRVNAVAPGHIEVERHWRNPSYTHEYGDSVVPWGRAGTPTDVAAVVAFLAADESELIDGQVICVDGGTTAKLCHGTWNRKENQT
jgi:NAD(P)-dependent dehydrogenase (short-subunit alcohol dehydrogenase family)